MCPHRIDVEKLSNSIRHANINVINKPKCLFCPVTGMAGRRTIDYAQRESQQRLPVYVLEETVSSFVQFHTRTHDLLR